MRSGRSILAAAALSASPVAAVDRLDHFYIGVRAVGAYAQLHDQATSGFTGRHEATNDSDVSLGSSGVAGVRLSRLPLRMEIEGHYTYRFDWDNRDVTAPTIDYESNIETMAILVNAVMEWRNRSSFTPVIGLSLG